MLVDTVFDGLEEQLKLKVDREKVIYLRMPYKGVPDPAVIRTKIDSKQKEVYKPICTVFMSLRMWSPTCLCYPIPPPPPPPPVSRGFRIEDPFSSTEG